MPQAQQPDQARREMPLQLRDAQLIPSSFNEAENTIDVVWTTGARRRAYDFWTDTLYEEELVVEPDAVDMTRFDAGAVQVLDNHRMYGGVGAILGIATRGWLENGQGLATIRLSQRPELAGIVQDIRAGIIRTISFGYSVERYSIIRAQDRTDGVNMPLYRAERYTPQEISFVTVPADPNAGTRSQQSQGVRHPCEFITRAHPASGGDAAASSTQGATMPQSNAAGGNNTPANDNNASRSQETGTSAGTQQTNQVATQPTDAERAAAAAETQRSADITDLCARHSVPHLAAGLIRGSQTIEQAQRAVLEELARRDAAGGGHRNVTNVQTVNDEHSTRLAGIGEALMHRCDARAQLTDNGRQYRSLSLLEMGRELLEGSGVRTRGMDRMTLATQIMLHRTAAGSLGTSDFGNLLANVANRRLRNAYDENPGTYAVWARRAPNAPDFKTMSVVQLAGTPDLLQVNEHGEFKYASMSDGKETYGLLTYGRIVSLTRQAIVNDDLRGFDRLVTAFGASARRLENRTVYSQLTANAALSDTIALFHANHANLATGAGSALQASSLKTMRTAMRVQKGLQSEELNLTPAYLIVPAALEQDAYQLTSSNYVPATKAEVNEFRQGGRTAIEPVVEPVLDANSATAWYAAAASSQVDTVEYCYLDGADGPVIESQMGFEIDGMQLKARHDFAAKAIDYRGLYKAAGA